MSWLKVGMMFLLPVIFVYNTSERTRFKLLFTVLIPSNHSMSAKRHFIVTRVALKVNIFSNFQKKIFLFFDPQRIFAIYAPNILHFFFPCAILFSEKGGDTHEEGNRL